MKPTTKLLFKTELMLWHVLTPLTDDLPCLTEEWQRLTQQAPSLFHRMPIILDVTQLPSISQEGLAGFMTLLKTTQIIPLGIRGLAPEKERLALQAGLAVITQKEAKPPTPTPSKTQVIERTVRSGSKIYAQNSDLILLASVNSGAEVIADGNIHVYGALRGRALAGATGDTQTRIFCQKLAAELLAIAGYYLVQEEMTLPTSSSPVQVVLDEQTLLIKEV